MEIYNTTWDTLQGFLDYYNSCGQTFKKTYDLSWVKETKCVFIDGTINYSMEISTVNKYNKNPVIHHICLYNPYDPDTEGQFGQFLGDMGMDCSVIEELENLE